MLKMIGIAAACVRHASAKRPQMGQVVFLLLIHYTNTKTWNSPLLHLFYCIVICNRIDLSQVVRAFHSLATADLSNGMRFGESQAFDSGQQSAEIRFFRMLAFGNQEYSSDFYSQGSSNA